MAIYELEERILFDGAMPVDIADVQDDFSAQETEDTVQNTESNQQAVENVSIAPDSLMNDDSADYQDDSAENIEAEPNISDLSNSSAELSEIDIALSGIEDIEMPEGYVPDVNVILVSTGDPDYDEILDSVNAGTIVVEYSPDDSVETIIQNLQDELGERNPVNVGVIGDRLLVNSDQLSGRLSELQTVDGDLNIIDLDAENSEYILSEYFDIDSDFLNQSPITDNQLPTELYFIDSKIDDVNQIIAEIPEDAIIIELADGEGVDRITEIVNEYSDIDAVHIISQGNYVQVMLGDDVITSDNISEYQDAFSSWNDNLTEDADILFYGCDIAKEAQGQSVINQIADWTGADIAASTDITGGVSNHEGHERHEDFSVDGFLVTDNGTLSLDLGNWDLEYSTGAIEAAVLFVESYSHHLETYTVTEITDNGSGSVEGSLSWAVEQSNVSTTVDDDIVFNLDSGDTVTIEGGTVTEANMLPKITDTVNIDGTNIATGNNVTVQVETPGTSAYRVFYINVSGETVTIENMTVKGGDISGLSDEAAKGGSIYIEDGNVNLSSVEISGSKGTFAGAVLINAGTVELNEVEISDSNATALGGAIFKNSGSLTITLSTIDNNEAINNLGGGIFNADGDLTVISSTISRNTAGDTGGGIFHGGGSLTVMSSAIYGNSADYNGGGIFSSSDSTIISSTITENNAGMNGGAINSSSGSLTVISSTISANTANNCGGGIYTSPSAYLLNTILISNTGDDIYTASGDTTYTYYCWYNQVGGSVNITDTGSQTGPYDTSLLGLYYNGGYTSTIAVSGSSTSVGNGVLTGSYDDSGTTKYAYSTDGSTWYKIDGSGNTVTGVTPDTTDQRGYYRTAGSITIGAYQYDGIVAKIGEATDWTSGANTFSAIQDAVDTAGSGNTVVLAGTSILMSDDEMSANGISVTKSLTITGEEEDSTSTTVRVTDAGVTESRVFEIDASGETVTIENMTIKGGDISGFSGDDAKGGAVNIAAGTVNLSGIEVSGSKAGDGGGIFNNGELTLSNTVVDSNEALNSNYGHGGGGIFNNGSTSSLTVDSSSVISNNTSAFSGGGIFNQEGSVEITSSTISGNAGNGATWEGGGGGIHNAEGDVSLTSVTVSNNTALFGDSSVGGGEGGGIYTRNGTLTVTNSEFTGNKAAVNGGGINNNGWTEFPDTVLTFTGTNTFSGNYTGANLNGIHSTKGEIALNDSTLNIADGITVSDTDFDAGTSLVNYNGTENISVLSETYYDLTVSGGGTKTLSGNVTVENDLTVDTGTTLALGTKNIAVSGASDIDGTVTVSTGEYDANGIFDASDGAFTFTSSGSLKLSGDTNIFGTFTAGSSTVTYDGGGQTIDTNIAYSTLQLSTSGGTVTKTAILTLTTANLTVDSDVTLDSANLAVTTLTTNSGTIEVSGTADFGSTTTSFGGTVAYDGGDQTVVALTYNALSFNGSTSDSTKTFADGTTKIASEIALTDTITLTGSSKDNVTVQVTNPGVTASRVFNINASGKTVTIDNMSIKGGDISGNGDTADGYGGAVYIAASATVNLDSVLVSDSIAFNGGGVYNRGNVLIVNSSKFISNSADSCGGGIFNENNSMTVNSTIFSKNSTEYNGGGIYILAGTSTVESSTFTANQADEYFGGGIYNASELTVTSTSFYGNFATSGGGIANSGTVNINTSTINENIVTEYGGAIYNSGAANVSLTTISGNIAVEHGGAIYNYIDSFLTVVSSTVSQNTAVNFCGGIYCEEGTNDVYLINSVVAGNYQNYDIYLESEGSVTGYYSWVDNIYGTLNGNNNITTDYSWNDIYGLSNYGGETLTMLSSVTSPALESGTVTGVDEDGDSCFYDIDAVAWKKYDGASATGNVTVDATDQRGESRPSAGAGATIGSVQRVASDSTYDDYINDTTWTVVTTEDDTLDFTDGEVSLRESITFTSSGSTVNFDSGITEIAIDHMLPFITGTLTVNGDNTVIISGDTDDNGTADTITGLFNISYNSSLTVKGLTLTNSFADYGGAFCNYGALTINNSTITENSAIVGGGFYNEGTLNITSSTLNENSANYGGVICNSGEGILLISSSTLSNNSAANEGGGINNAFNCIVSIESTTISGNSGNSYGGGISNYGNLTVVSSTVSDNSAGDGGGIYNKNNSYLLNSIVINNTAGDGGDIYTYSEKTTYAYYSRYNQVAGDGTISTQDAAPNITIAYTEGDLGQLQDNGGSTYTMALSLSSPSVDTGTTVYYNETEDYYYFVDDNGISHKLSDWNTNPTVVEVEKITTDQRGATRHSTPSIGAYEFYADYTSDSDGSWETASNWTVFNGISTSASDIAPDADNSSLITVGNAMTVESDLSIDQTVVLSSGSITVEDGITLTVADGTGDDLTVNGTGAIDINGILIAADAQIVYSEAGTLNLVQDSFSVNSFTAGSSTVTYDGGDQTIAALEYYSLSFAGSTTGSTKTFADGTTSIASEIELTDTITFTGSSKDNVTVQVTAPGTTASRVFNINASGKTVTIENMTIKGGDISGIDYPNYYGGSVYIQHGTVNINNVSVSGSKASLGGGIYNAYGCTLNLTSSSVYGNTGESGGGIYNAWGGILNLASSTINSNVASSGGGGIYNKNGTVEIISSTINGNTALSGGGIYNYGTLISVSSTFSGNAAEYGAGIYNSGTSESTYLINTVVAGNFGDYDIYIESEGTVTGYYSWVANASSELEGENNITDDYSWNDIYGLANYGGETLSMLVSAVSPALESGTITGVDEAGDNCFYDIDTESWKKYDGSSASGNVTVDSTDQRGENRPSAGTGATIGSVQRSASDSDYDDYINDTNWTVVSTENDILDFTDGVVSLREAMNFASVGSTVTFASEITSIAIDYMLPVIGRALTIDGSNLVTVSGDINSDGTSDTVTGLFNVATGGDLTVSGLTVTKGDSSKGGAFYNVGTLSIEDSSEITLNNASYGGALYNKGSLTISSSTVSSSTAIDGGGIYNTNNLVLSGTTVDNNTASISGGGIYNKATVTVTASSVISGNTAEGVEVKEGGGGIYNQNTVDVISSIISGNTASKGGGIFSYMLDTTINVTSSTITGNTATAGNGGGIFNYKGTVDVSDLSVISSNTATENGGGIYNGEGTTLDITSSAITKNTAASGAGIYSYVATLDITSSTMTENTATGGGGAVYANGTLTVSSSEFSSNTADNGAGIYCSGTVLIDRSTISNNTGNGIYSIGNLTITSSTISENFASKSGAGIYIGYGDVYIVSSTISGNSSDLNGGGIYNFFGSVYLLNTIVINNTGGSGGDIYAERAESKFYAYYSRYNQVYGDITVQDAALNITTEYTEGELGQLQDNGGSTYTMALSLSSPSVDTGTTVYYNETEDYYYFVDDNGISHKLSDWDTNPTVVEVEKITTDQRGATRHSTPSIGAYEFYADYTSDSDGSWETASNWTIFNGILTSTADIAPDADNSTLITVDNVMTVENDLSIDQTVVSSSGSITVEDGITLTVANGAGTDLDADGTITVNKTSSAGTLLIASGASVDSDGEFTVNGLLSFDDGGDNNGSLNIAAENPVIVALTAGSGTITYDGEDQAVAALEYYNLSFAGSGTKSLSGTTTVNNDLTLNDSDITLAVGDNTLTVSGNMNVTSGNLTVESGTIKLGGTSNSLGTFTAGVGSTVEYNGRSGQTVLSETYYNLTISDDVIYSGTDKILGGDITVNGDLIIDRMVSFDVSANNYAINLKGNFVNNGTFNAQSGTVTLSGISEQSMSGQYLFYNLVMNNTGNAVLASNITIENKLTLTAGLLTLGAYRLTLNENATIGGTPSSSSMIVTNSTGKLRKHFNELIINNEFLFPLGTNSSEYTPITIEFEQCDFFPGAYVDVSVDNEKAPNNTSTTNYLNRYWTLEYSDIVSPLTKMNVTCQYSVGDVIGNESDIRSAVYYNSSWHKYTAADVENHTILIADLRNSGNITGVDKNLGSNQNQNVSPYNSDTDTKTHTSWCTGIDDGPENSIDNDEGFEPNQVEGLGMYLGSLITFDISSEAVANGEYSLGAGAGNDGVYGIENGSGIFMNDGENDVKSESTLKSMAERLIETMKSGGYVGGGGESSSESGGESADGGESGGEFGEAGESSGYAGVGGESSSESGGETGDVGESSSESGGESGDVGESGGESAGESGDAGVEGESSGESGYGGDAAGDAGESGDAGVEGESSGESGYGGDAAGDAGESGEAGESGGDLDAPDDFNSGYAGESGESGGAGESGGYAGVGGESSSESGGETGDVGESSSESGGESGDVGESSSESAGESGGESAGESGDAGVEGESSGESGYGGDAAGDAGESGEAGESGGALDAPDDFNSGYAGESGESGGAGESGGYAGVGGESSSESGGETGDVGESSSESAGESGGESGGEYGEAVSPNRTAELIFDFDSEDSLIDYEAIAAYSDKHPLFKMELDLLLEKI